MFTKYIYLLNGSQGDHLPYLFDSNVYSEKHSEIFLTELIIVNFNLDKQQNFGLVSYEKMPHMKMLLFFQEKYITIVRTSYNSVQSPNTKSFVLLSVI